MLEQLKNFDEDRYNLDEMVALLSFAKDLNVTYADQGLEPPSWLKENTRSLERVIQAARRDDLEARLVRARARQEQLATPAEQRKDVAQEIQALEAELEA